MAVTLDLPQVGESVVEGIIGKWLKQPGDKLEKYDPLVEVVTDKVTMEVPSPVNGVLSRILVEEGATVPMGTPIAEIETDESLPPAAPVQASAVPASAPENVGTIGYLVKDVKPVGPTGGGIDEVPPLGTKPLVAPAVSASAEQAPAEDKARYSPAVRRLAQEHNVDLAQVKGSGVGGRITRNDVLNFVETQAGEAATSPTALPTISKTASGATGPDEEAMPLSPIRRIIAQAMIKSAGEIPHAWSMVEADVSDLVKHREGMKEEFRQREGVDLTYLPFVIKSVVESLKEHPMLNSSWGGDTIILKRRIHIGIAVAATDGLIVPVIHDADSFSIAGLAKMGADLTNRARQGKLSLPEVQGGTFTVNNTGALGSIVSQPIINYPQAAILTTEAIQKRPVVVGDAIAIRSIMNVCLSFDHRIVDGAESSAFLQSVKRHLEAMDANTAVY